MVRMTALKASPISVPAIPKREVRTVATGEAIPTASISELAKRVGYEPFLFENIVMGKTRQVPVDFFIRIADVLDISTVEKDDLVRSRAFGIECWNWSFSIDGSPRGPVKRRAG
jgi:hypothetical protein